MHANFVMWPMKEILWSHKSSTEHLAPTGGIMSNELSNCFQIFDMGMTRYDLSINKMCMLEEPNACSFAATLGGLYYVY